MAYEVQTPVYQGPFDLLLHLILREDVDLYEISLARIVDAYIGPFTSIGPGSRVEKSEVENSIILENCQIVDIGSRMSDSLIGRNVSIYRLPVRPSAYRFMLGDNSEVGIRW